MEMDFQKEKKKKNTPKTKAKHTDITKYLIYLNKWITVLLETVLCQIANFQQYCDPSMLIQESHTH